MRLAIAEQEKAEQTEATVRATAAAERAVAEHQEAARRALTLFEEYEHTAFAGGDVCAQLHVAIYNRLLSIFSDSFSDSPDDFSRVERHMREHGVQPDEATFTLLVRGLVNRGDYDEAMRVVLGSPQRGGVVPKARTYGSLLDAMCEHGRVGSVVEIHEEIKRQVQEY